MKYLELAEKKKHGTRGFPIEYYYIDQSHPRYVMRAHWHKEFEIIRVLFGKFTIYLNNVKYELFEGDCLLIEGGCLKQGHPEECVYECLVFDTAMLRRQVMSDSEKSYLDLTSSSFSYKNLIDRADTELYSSICELFAAMREAEPFYELKIVGLLYDIFFEMHTKGYIIRHKNRAMERGLKTVTSLLEWIENNICEPITLSKLSSVTGLSEKYICRIFKLYTSKTVTEYINEQRVENACIAMADKSITDVAFSSGFNDLSYFCKIFKRYKGMSPSEYKKFHYKNNFEEQ